MKSPGSRPLMIYSPEQRAELELALLRQKVADVEMLWAARLLGTLSEGAYRDAILLVDREFTAAEMLMEYGPGRNPGHMTIHAAELLARLSVAGPTPLMPVAWPPSVLPVPERPEEPTALREFMRDVVQRCLRHGVLPSRVLRAWDVRAG